MAFDTKQFIEQSRAKGIPDEETYKFLQSKGITSTAQPTQKPQQSGGLVNNLTQGAIGFAKGAGRSIVGIGKTIFNNPMTNPIAEVTQLFPKVQQKISNAVFSPYDKALEPTNKAQKVGGYIELAAEILGPAVYSVATSGPKLIQSAESLYLKALKPSIALSVEERANLAITGLKEGITVSKAGVDKAAEVISVLEDNLASAIKNAGGKKINTTELKPFVDAAKHFLGQTVDVAESEKASQQIDAVYQNFIKKYGTEIDTKTAQTLKVNTYQVLKQYYDKMAAPTIEASKQLARGLKEGILKNAPQVGEINKRLGGLYNFEAVLERATNRASNANEVSLGGKILASGGSPAHLGASFINELFGAKGKSLLAIGEDKLGQLLSKLSPQEHTLLKTIIQKAGRVGTTGLLGKPLNVISPGKSKK